MEKEHLLTSNIQDIPVDVATPVSAFFSREKFTASKPPVAPGAQHHKSLRHSSRSMTRLGEGRVRNATSYMSGMLYLVLLSCVYFFCTLTESLVQKRKKKKNPSF